MNHYLMGGAAHLIICILLDTGFKYAFYNKHE
uniref:Uncharacterized protein n=1 Tax=Siphoviridae sp. ctZHD14 TaxID=2827891 RepID=A0A8S5SWH9_9CAUD|nr:MAG TPA: hypothetical protein [Siphoviridae sp. ctZHD14]